MRHSRHKTRRFSLIEILVVVSITFLLMMLALPAFEKITVGTGVDAAARAVGAQLRLARQYAITNRQYVAVLLPAQNFDDTNSRYVSFRTCIVDNPGSDPTASFDSWIPNTKWEFVPSGGVLAQLRHQSAGGYDTLQTPPADVPGKRVDNVDNDSGEDNIRAIIFAPTGKVLGNTQILIVAEGANTGGALLIRNDDNTINLIIDTYTGRVSYE